MNQNSIKRGFAPLFLFIILLLATCTTRVKPDPSVLNAQVHLYSRFMIWQKYADAEKMVAPQFINRIEEDAKNKRYTDIKIIKIEPLTKDKRKFKVLVRREYYLLNNNTVKTEIVKQIWQFKGNNGWILMSEEKVR